MAHAEISLLPAAFPSPAHAFASPGLTRPRKTHRRAPIGLGLAPAGMRTDRVGLLLYRKFAGRSPMRSVYAVGLLVGIAFTVLASTRPSVAVVIYPWAQITADAADMENKAPDHIVDVVGKELENGPPRASYWLGSSASFSEIRLSVQSTRCLRSGTRPSESLSASAAAVRTLLALFKFITCFADNVD
jgi:hypothetical protein